MSKDFSQNLHSPLKVALVHDWLTGMRGGEYVLEAIAELFPNAELFTLLHVPGSISPFLSRFKIHTSWLQKVPQAEHRYRYFLPLMPSMIERFDLSGFDLVISSSHCVAKGIRKSKGAVHVSYVHAPMRYIWDRYDDYFGPGRSSFPVRLAAKTVRTSLQKWDRSVSRSERVDLLIANSHFIAQQIHRAYHREAQVIHPFADLSRFQKLSLQNDLKKGQTNALRQTSQTYLMVTAFAPYKRIDLAIEAFNEMKLPLSIVGSGQEEKRLKSLAGPTIQFLGSLSNDEITSLYTHCKAFIFPGVEDFGITPLEAMAAGAPVIAIREGGATETVTEKTGVFFESQTKEALMDAVQKIETQKVRISPLDCQNQAQSFSRPHFQKKMMTAIEGAWIAAGKDRSLLIPDRNS